MLTMAQVNCIRELFFEKGVGISQENWCCIKWRKGL